MPYLHAPNDVSAAILSSVAAVIGMIPQGLVLLTSSVLAIATARLAFKKVLINKRTALRRLPALIRSVWIRPEQLLRNMEVAHIVDADLTLNPMSHISEALAAITDANRHDANDTAQVCYVMGAAQFVMNQGLRRSRVGYLR